MRFPSRGVPLGLLAPLTLACGASPPPPVVDPPASEVTVAPIADAQSAAPPVDASTPAAAASARIPDAPPAARPPSQAVPSRTVAKLATPHAIKVDGKGDDAAWAGAASTGAFINVATGEPNTQFPVDGSAKLLWDDDNLYVLFEVREPGFYVGFTNAKAQPNDFTAAGQPKLWIHDTVEMMLEPDAEGTNSNYYELQINPQNRIFKSRFDTLQMPNGGANGPFGHEDWDPHLKSAVTIQRGADGKSSGYTIEVAIPWSAYVTASHHAPVTGETWRLNFYAMRNNGGVAWSPILGQGNFHKASRFGKIVWGASTPNGP